MPKEKLVIKKIKAFVESEGGKVYNYHGNQFSVSGFPDLVIILNGATFFVEVKALGKRPTHIQLHRIDEINEAGGWAFWTDSLEGFKANLDKKGYLI